MKPTVLCALLIGAVAMRPIEARKQPEFDLLIKGGHVIDPKNNINGVMDVAVKDKKIHAVAARINEPAKQVIDATGLYVSPGLIDIHGHYFFGTEPDAYLANSFTAVPPDAFTFRSGVTTSVDAGCPGWKNFSIYKKQTIDHSKTKIGYEIPVNRYFYVYQPPRDLEAIEKDIDKLEKAILAQLKKVVS